MHVWIGTEHAHGDTHQQGHDGHSSCQHHGQQAHSQCHAVWHVPVTCQPDGGSSYSSRTGRVGTHALHSDDNGTLVAWSPYCDDRQYADFEQQLQAHVHVGRCHLHQRTRSVHSDGALTRYVGKNTYTTRQQETSVMDYRFTMTSRLIALTVISFLLLLGLLFALGFQLGLQWGTEEANAQRRTATSALQPAPVSPPVSMAVPATIPAATVSVPAMPTGLGVTPR